MKTEIFKHFCDSNYSKCYELGKHACNQNIENDELCYILLICSIASMNEGSLNIDNSLQWLGQNIENQLNNDSYSGNNLAILLAYEGSKFFNNAQKANKLLTKAYQMSSNKITTAVISFFNGMYELNTTQDYSKVLNYFNNTLEELQYYIDFSFNSFCYLWCNCMVSHIYNRQNKHIESINLATDTLKKSEMIGFTPLVENCYLNIAFSYQGQGKIKEAYSFIDKNINYWKEKNIPKRIAVASTFAIIIALESRDIDKARNYMQIRKTNWVPLEMHWNMIEDACLNAGFVSESKNWTWSTFSKNQ